MVGHLIGYDDITALAKGREGTGQGGIGVGVYDATLGTEEGCDVGFGLHVDILGAVELGRTAGANSVGAQRLDGLFLDGLVGIEVVKVVGSEVRDGLSVGQLGLRTGRSIETYQTLLVRYPRLLPSYLLFITLHSLPNYDR